MALINAVNRERIESCCAEQGMAPSELADVLDMSADRWGAFWTHGAGLTFNQLRKLAEHFGRGVLFFLELGPVVAEQMHTPQFRTLAQQKPELSQRLRLLIERVERQRALFLILREDLDDALWSPFQAPDLPAGNVAAAAKATRLWLGLGEGKNDFESYRKAVEAKGILVFRTNGYKGPRQIAKESPVAGFALYGEQCPVIVVKKMATDAPQAYTLMHELAHVLLHKASRIDDEADLRSTQGREQEANLFAGLVLVPDHFLASISDADRPDDELKTHERAIPVVALEEVGHMAPECAQWLKNAEALQLPMSEAVVMTAMAIKQAIGVVNDQYHPKGVDENDLLIIASAKVHGAELITNEARQFCAQAEARQYKIPAVCDMPAVVVSSLNFLDYIQKS